MDSKGSPNDGPLPGGERMTIPETHYARTADDVSIAYQVLGEGSADLIFSWGWISNVEYAWEHPWPAA